MSFSKGNLAGRKKLVPLALVVVPLVLALLKVFCVGGPWLGNTLSLTGVPDAMHDRVSYIMFMSLGALIVVLTRLTLGIRVLGPFRSILLAIAFQITGILSGLVFLVLVLSVVSIVRPLLRAIRIPYFGRVSVILTTVAAIMAAAVLVGEWLETEGLRGIAYFPIVVLCLAGDGFARTLVKEGPRSAVWRGFTTAVVAVVIALMASVSPIERFMLRFPEVLIFEIGFIIVIAEYFDLRLLQGLNPKPVDRRKKVSSERSPGGNGSSQKGKRESRRRMETPVVAGNVEEVEPEYAGAGRE